MHETEDRLRTQLLYTQILRTWEENEGSKGQLPPVSAVLTLIISPRRWLDGWEALSNGGSNHLTNHFASPRDVEILREISSLPVSELVAVETASRLNLESQRYWLWDIPAVKSLAILSLVVLTFVWIWNWMLEWAPWIRWCQSKLDHAGSILVNSDGSELHWLVTPAQLSLSLILIGLAVVGISFLRRINSVYIVRGLDLAIRLARADRVLKDARMEESLSADEA